MAEQGRIIPTTATSAFPGCALSCVTLLNAQDLCYPPNQPQSTQTTYNNCFCQSPSTSLLYSTPDALCTSECTIEADRQLLRAWFTTFCQQVGAGLDPVTATTTTLVTSTITPTGTAPATISATSPAHDSASSNDGQSWIQGHWKWVVMLGVLVVGLSAMACLAVWLKKRHRRKVEARRAAASGFPRSNEKRPEGARSATPDLWGPHQMMQATQGYQYTTEGLVEGTAVRGSRRNGPEGSSKHHDMDRLEVTEVEGSSGLRSISSSTRQRPSELELNSRLIGAADRRSKKRRDQERQRMADQDIEPSPQRERKSKHSKRDQDEGKS